MTKKEKQIHLITSYEAFFNDTNYTCAITIDIQKFKIDCLIDKELLFSVDYKSSNIRVESDEDLFLFLNADKELIYYASKTDTLPLIYGTTNPAQLIGSLLAKPNFEIQDY